ncbi:MAG: acetyl/propionyl/methylcrotonyl-CoA carboxylase subunit alpha [Halieaceae bacterium]|nr:acetyl/propionyl/methylcrotonyl-CoA carboxylase subunit alpha [Halieaceae bacterium]
MSGFDSVLVANRGEIACRVIRSAQAHGYRTIAVYSEADADAPHVQMADQAVLIGPPPVKESYLDAGRILEAAARTGAQAIHPGYGFLSENADFARACGEAGLVFIGPSAEAIDAMGNKAESKRRMLDAEVPCIPGYQDTDQSDKTLIAAAADIGFPIMVKAAAGGGGRGMRLVHDAAELPDALASARSEAESAFGSGELILEKAVLQPRHVELQVFGDQHGNVIHLGERDCSVQRRHQKVVEESPCAVMTDELRAAMGEAAVNAAKSIDYVGAGTVEFLLDADNNFYFLEMNTRLQVEHPVTELVTDLDLVALQLDVAQGLPLPLSQEEVTLTGHAIEVRLYAEDSQNDFLPASGPALLWRPPSGEGVRVDHGLLQGQEVSPFYDPMVAKIITWGPDREVARRRLLRALENTALFGFETNRAFLVDVLANQCFAQGGATTAFIAEQFPDGYSNPVPGEALPLVAACLHYLQGLEGSEQGMVAPSLALSGWSGSQGLSSHVRYEIDEQALDIHVGQLGTDRYRVSLGEAEHEIAWLHELGDGSARIALDGVQYNLAFCFPARGEVALQLGGHAAQFTNQLAFTAADMAGAGSGTVTAPMHGNLLDVMVAVGDTVTVGDGLLVMEAMKMEHRLVAEVAGEVVAIHANTGEQVSAGAVLLEIAEAG